METKRTGKVLGIKVWAVADSEGLYELCLRKPTGKNAKSKLGLKIITGNLFIILPKKSK